MTVRLFIGAWVAIAGAFITVGGAELERSSDTRVSLLSTVGLVLIVVGAAVGL